MTSARLRNCLNALPHHRRKSCSASGPSLLLSTRTLCLFRFGFYDETVDTFTTFLSAHNNSKSSRRVRPVNRVADELKTDTKFIERSFTLIKTTIFVFISRSVNKFTKNNFGCFWMLLQLSNLPAIALFTLLVPTLYI